MAVARPLPPTYQSPHVADYESSCASPPRTTPSSPSAAVAVPESDSRSTTPRPAVTLADDPVQRASQLKCLAWTDYDSRSASPTRSLPSTELITRSWTPTLSVAVSSTAHDPVYRPLRQLDQEFRVITLLPASDHDEEIVCNLGYFSLASPPPYVALSYCWGERPGHASIWLDKHRVDVTRNLYDALLQLRSHECYQLWIDALCIDQDDLDERSMQVKRMSAIYRRAKAVAIWVGRAANGSDKVMQALRTGRGLAVLPLQQMKSFVDRPYWQRVWIIQEVASAMRVSIFCGAQIVEWDSMEYLLSWAHHSDAFDKYQLRPIQSLCEFRDAKRHGRRPAFLDVFRRVRLLQSSERRDKIFAILGLTYDGEDFVPEPNYHISESALCQSITESAIISRQSVDLILLASSRPEWSHLPSWCPDFLSVRSHPFSADTIHYLCGQDERWRVGTQTTRWMATANSRATSPTVKFRNNIMQVQGWFAGIIASLASPADCEDYQTRHSSPSPNRRGSRSRSSSHSSTRSSIRPPSSPTTTVKSMDALSRIFKLYDPQYHSHAHAQWIRPYLWAALDELGSVRWSNQLDRLGHLAASNCRLLINWFRANADFQIRNTSLRDWAAITSSPPSSSGEKVTTGYFNACIDRLPYADDDPDRLAMTDLLDEGMRLFTTHEDDLGWAHPAAREGDTVWLVAGCSVPVVLRSTGGPTGGCVTFVGHAYVDGLMDGQVWRDLDANVMETISVC